MTISRWKLMAGLLGLSVGGLAMCCAQTTPLPPVAPKIDLTDPVPINLPSPPPAAEAKPAADKEIEIVLPILASPKPVELLPVKAEEKKTSPPLGEIPSLSGNYEPPAPAKSEPVKPKPEPTVPTPTPVSGLDLVDSPLTPAKPEAKPPVDLTPEPVKIAAPPTPIKTATPPAPVNNPPMLLEEPKAPARLTVTEVPAAKPIPQPETKPDAAGGKLKMLLRMGSGTPRFEIRSVVTEELLFKVYGQKIEMQSSTDSGKGSPLAGVTASGKVRFTGPGVEGTCDSLTLLSGTGEVLMKGNVQLKTKSGRTWSELAAEKMMYQIGLTGLKATPNPVTPTSFRD